MNKPFRQDFNLITESFLLFFYIIPLLIIGKLIVLLWPHLFYKFYPTLTSSSLPMLIVKLTIAVFTLVGAYYYAFFRTVRYPHLLNHRRMLAIIISWFVILSLLIGVVTYTQSTRLVGFVNHLLGMEILAAEQNKWRAWLNICLELLLFSSFNFIPIYLGNRKATAYLKRHPEYRYSRMPEKSFRQHMLLNALGILGFTVLSALGKTFYHHQTMQYFQHTTWQLGLFVLVGGGGYVMLNLILNLFRFRFKTLSYQKIWGVVLLAAGLNLLSFNGLQLN